MPAPSKLTSISDLTGIASSGGRSPLWEGDSDLSQTLGSGAGPDAFVTSQDDVLQFTIGTLELGLDGDDFVVEQALLLRLLGALEALGSVFVHLLPSDAEVPANIFAGPAHGLHAVDRLLAVSRDALVEGLVKRITTDSHRLCADGNTNIDVSGGDGIGDVGCSLEPRGAKSVDGRSASCVGEAGGERGGTELIGCFGVRDLGMADRTISKKAKKIR